MNSAKPRSGAHILEGYKIALDNLDEVIAMIRASKSTAEGPRTSDGTVSNSAKYRPTLFWTCVCKDWTALERDKIVQDYENILKEISRNA